MRHHIAHRTLNRDTRQRTALMRGLATSLILHKKIKTTTAKAKEVRPFVEKMVTEAKKDTLAARRRILSLLGQPDASILEHLCNDLAKKYADREGGYTRIIKVGRTKAGRDESVIEFV